MLISASLLSLLHVPTSALEQLHNNPWQDFHQAFLRQTIDKKAISGIRFHLSQYYIVLVLPALSSVTANAFINTHWASLWKEKNGMGSLLLVWDAEDFSCSASIPSSNFVTFPSLMTWPQSFSLNEQIIVKNEQMSLWWQRSSQGIFTSGSVCNCCRELILNTKQLGKMSL